MQMFRNQIFVVAVVVTFLTGIGMFGALTFMPWFIQGALGASATNSGVVNTPMMLGLVVASTISGQLVSRFGHYRVLIVLGGVILAVGMYLMTLMSENTAQVVAMRNMVMIGVGLGLSMPLLTLVVQNTFSYQLLGVATSTIVFFRSIGGTLGIAVFGTIVTSQIRSGLRAELPPDVTATVPQEMITPLEDPQILLSPSALDRLRQGFDTLGADGPRLFTETVTSMRAVLADSLVDVFFAGFVVAVVALLVSAFIREVPLRTRVEMQAGPSEPPASLREKETSEASDGS
jgi:MFS family permease